MKTGVALVLILCAPQDPVKEQVERLGSDETEVREKVSAEFLKLGEAAIPALERATKHPDAEIRVRAKDLLKRLAREALRGPKFFDARAAGKPDPAVAAALGWLARHQNADGSWSATAYVKRCKEACKPNPGEADYDAAMTGLALLAFLGAGHTHQSKEVLDGMIAGDVVRRGFESLITQQGRDGGLTSNTGQKYMYGHSVCALALAEAYGMTRAEVYRAPLEKAVGYTLAAQNPGKGWRYSSKCGDNDTSVTFWAALSLRVAWYARIDVRAAAFDGAKAWLEEATDENGRVGYTHRGTGKVFVPGLNEQYDHHETMSAIAGFLRILLDGDRDAPAVGAEMNFLIRDRPRWEGNAIDFYYWHAATLALFQYAGPGGAEWNLWEAALRKALLLHQRAKDAGCAAGSWDPVDRWSGEGGRVYATAINALTLETAARYRVVPGR